MQITYKMVEAALGKMGPVLNYTGSSPHDHEMMRGALEAALSAAPSGMAEPVAWVIPGDDNARDNGFIDAMVWKEGEFTRPLFAAPPASEREEIERLKALLSRTQRHLKLFEGTSGYRDGEIQLLRDVSAALQTEGK